MNDEQDAFAEAFQGEVNEDLGVETPEVEAPETEETPETKETPEIPETPEPEEAPEPEEQEETPKPEEEAPETKEDEEAPKFATKEDIIAALREDRESTSKHQAEVQQFSETVKKSVIEQLHPDGIDNKLYDSNGKVINTAQDIVDRGLINPDTQEPFEYEEAARWMLNAQQTMNKQVEDLNAYAEQVADVYVNLKEGNDRVEELYGDYLKVMPGVAQQLSEAYAKTLVKDENGIVIRAPLDPVEYYQMSLAPYIKLGEEMVAKSEREAREAKEAEEVQKNERMGLPQRGQSKSKPNTGDPFLDALIEEMEEA